MRTAWLVGLVWVALGCGERPSDKSPDTPSPDAGAERSTATQTAPPTSRATPEPVDAAPRNDAARPTVGSCVGEPGDKPIMAPCADHCECETGFCYDEAFNGGGFCSMDCNAPSIGDCAKLKHPTLPQHQKYGCLRLDGMKARHGLKTTRICVLRCAGVDECRAYSPRYDQCGNFSGGRGTQWGGFTLGLFGTCLISSAVDPDAP